MYKNINSKYLFIGILFILIVFVGFPQSENFLTPKQQSQQAVKQRASQQAASQQAVKQRASQAYQQSQQAASQQSQQAASQQAYQQSQQAASQQAYQQSQQSQQAFYRKLQPAISDCKTCDEFYKTNLSAIQFVNAKIDDSPERITKQFDLDTIKSIIDQYQISHDNNLLNKVKEIELEYNEKIVEGFGEKEDYNNIIFIVIFVVLFIVLNK